jgi:hypothetical protein
MSRGEMSETGTDFEKQMLQTAAALRSQNVCDRLRPRDALFGKLKVVLDLEDKNIPHDAVLLFSSALHHSNDSGWTSRVVPASCIHSLDPSPFAQIFVEVDPQFVSHHCEKRISRLS